MHDLAKQVFDLANTINRAVAAAVQADRRGTPEALADCQKRQREAQKRAIRASEWAEHEATFYEGE